MLEKYPRKNLLTLGSVFVIEMRLIDSLFSRPMNYIR
jgi:hypothetical protein